MTTIQKILLIAACVLFVLTIYGFYHFSIYFIVPIFLLHSVCLVAFVYYTYIGEKDSMEEDGVYKQELGLKMAEKDQEISALQTMLMEKNESLEKFESESKDLKEKGAKLKERVTELEGEKENLSEELNEKKKAEEELKESLHEASQKGLLPVAEGDGRSAIDLLSVARDAIEEMRSAAMGADVHVSISSSLTSLMVKADRNRFRILFRNIIDNSIKYMNRPGALVITMSSVGEDIFIVLKDSGAGLPEEEIARVFDLNFQGSNRVSGNGLGLTQAKAIVDYYGGTIYARSSEGTGMGIYIQLPADLGENEKDKGKQTKGEKKKHKGKLTKGEKKKDKGKQTEAEKEEDKEELAEVEKEENKEDRTEEEKEEDKEDRTEGEKEKTSGEQTEEGNSDDVQSEVDKEDGEGQTDKDSENVKEF